MTTPTQLGIITNYNGDILIEGNIKNPTEILLEKWYGLTNNNGPMKSEGLNVNDIDIDVTITDPERLNTERLNKYFKGKFGNFDKISLDSEPKQSLDSPFSGVFKVEKLIIIYLEANQNNDGSWNTTDSSANRIYLFDKDGNEVRTRATTQDNNKSKFYEIKIENNDLKLLKGGIEVIFSFVEAAMTLAKLISELLDTDITYQGKSPDRTVTRTPGVPTRATPAAAAAETAGGAAEIATGPSAAETAASTTPDAAGPADNAAAAAAVPVTGRRRGANLMRSNSMTPQKKPEPSSQQLLGSKDDLYVNENNTVPQREVGDRQLELGSATQSPFVGSNNETTKGGKKTRKRRNRKTKKNKGGKKSRKQIKSMRKMKRSSSKK